MTALTESFAQRLNTNPDATYSVLITLHPDAVNKAPAALNSAGVQPIDGLQGIYKATLSGQELLRLQNDDSVQAIEPDEPDFHALG